ncbi:hypothetical protein RA274_28975, partial [Pseudomonas syringae pv. tagetis]|uniref:hypothetical protein n=1 Tax=Pseudomonas syringae group genomosp. 7 TaxID=251699 RepID=UPI0037705DB7
CVSYAELDSLADTLPIINKCPSDRFSTHMILEPVGQGAEPSLIAATLTGTPQAETGGTEHIVEQGRGDFQ